MFAKWGVSMWAYDRKQNEEDVRGEVLHLMTSIYNYSPVNRQIISPAVRDLVNIMFECGFICEDEKDQLESHFDEMIHKKR